jgi:23S rRNA (guanosine2251-2'-O)-methyltransferase
MKEERRGKGGFRPERNERSERSERRERPMRTAYEVRQEPKEEVEGQLEGRNALQEALRAGRTIDKVFIASGDTDKGLQRLAAEAKEAGAVVVPVDRRKLDNMSFTRSHQGVIALAAAHEYATIDEILEEAENRGQSALIVICDELTDPHNLGAILRSAECAGAHGVIIPKRRSVGLTATVAKASAGAMEYMKVARVTNINSAIAELKEKGVWVFGTAAEGSVPMYQANLTVPAAIVIGNEGDGMSPLVRKNCDVMVNIPMNGRISSLNASAAASILLYEAVRQRLK